jgi:hypothetical protein
MLSKEVDERPSSCRELIAEIDVCLEAAGKCASVVVSTAAVLATSKRHSTPVEPSVISRKLSSLFTRASKSD